jgi:hypothetical protein
VRSNTSTLLVAFLTIVTLAALSGYQVTSETSSVRLLGRLGAALIEIDRWLPAHRHDIELLARDRPDQPLVLTELPIQVPIPAQTALEAPTPVLEATIVEAMGRKLYQDGYGAVQDEQGDSHLSLTEPLRWAIDTLDSSAHSFWRVAMAVSGLSLLAICLAHLWVRHSPLPGLAIGSVAAAVFALVAWLVVSVVSPTGGGALDQEIAKVARDGLWLGLRNSFAATGIAVGGLYFYNTLIGPRHHEDWDAWDDFDYEGHEETRQTPPY